MKFVINRRIINRLLQIWSLKLLIWCDNFLRRNWLEWLQSYTCYIMCFMFTRRSWCPRSVLAVQEKSS